MNLHPQSPQGKGVKHLIGNEFTCAREACATESRKTTHNQKYCSNECCRIETNRKIMEKYHEKAAIKRGKKRACGSCGGSLSRYNETNTCGGCQASQRNKTSGSVESLVGAVAWL